MDTSNPTSYHPLAPVDTNTSTPFPVHSSFLCLFLGQKKK